MTTGNYKTNTDLSLSIRTHDKFYLFQRLLTDHVSLYIFNINKKSFSKFNSYYDIFLVECASFPPSIRNVDVTRTFDPPALELSCKTGYTASNTIDVRKCRPGESWTPSTEDFRCYIQGRAYLQCSIEILVEKLYQHSH